MALSFKTCKRCGNIFQNFMGEYCESCQKEIDQIYVAVRDFLYDNPNATVKEVVEETGAEENLILDFLKDGRLEMTTANGLLRCEKCGKAISSGRMCDACKQSLSNVLTRSLETSAARRKAAARADDKGYKSNLLKKK